MNILRQQKRPANHFKGKGAGKRGKSGVPVLSSPAGGRVAAGVDSPGLRSVGPSAVGCCGCGVLVTDDVSALQCDECLSPEVWKCASCLGLDPVAYAALARCKELEWRCDGCKRRSPKYPSHEAGIADRIGEVLVAIGGVMERLAGLEDRFKDKTDVGRTIAVENGLRNLEERLLAVERMTERLEIVDKLEGRVSDLERIGFAGWRREERARSGMDEGLGREDEVGLGGGG